MRSALGLAALVAVGVSRPLRPDAYRLTEHGAYGLTEQANQSLERSQPFARMRESDFDEEDLPYIAGLYEGMTHGQVEQEPDDLRARLIDAKDDARKAFGKMIKQLARQGKIGKRGRQIVHLKKLTDEERHTLLHLAWKKHRRRDGNSIRGRQVKDSVRMVKKQRAMMDVQIKEAPEDGKLEADLATIKEQCDTHPAKECAQVGPRGPMCPHDQCVIEKVSTLLFDFINIMDCKFSDSVEEMCKAAGVAPQSRKWDQCPSRWDAYWSGEPTYQKKHRNGTVTQPTNTEECTRYPLSRFDGITVASEDLAMLKPSDIRDRTARKRLTEEEEQLYGTIEGKIAALNERMIHMATKTVAVLNYQNGYAVCQTIAVGGLYAYTQAGLTGRLDVVEEQYGGTGSTIGHVFLLYTTRADKPEDASSPCGPDPFKPSPPTCYAQYVDNWYGGLVKKSEDASPKYIKAMKQGNCSRFEDKGALQKETGVQTCFWPYDRQKRYWQLKQPLEQRRPFRGGHKVSFHTQSGWYFSKPFQDDVVGELARHEAYLRRREQEEAKQRRAEEEALRRREQEEAEQRRAEVAAREHEEARRMQQQQQQAEVRVRTRQVTDLDAMEEQEDTPRREMIEAIKAFLAKNKRLSKFGKVVDILTDAHLKQLFDALNDPQKNLAYKEFKVLLRRLYGCKKQSAACDASYHSRENDFV